MKLNLGCSDEVIPGYIGVDIAPPADLIVDLSGGPVPRVTFMGAFGGSVEYDPLPWPWEDSTIEAIRAYDVFEHLADKIRTLNEAWRVLEPGGLLDFAVPCVYIPEKDGSPGPVNPGAFADPTHRSYWTLDCRYYYLEEWNNPFGERGRLGPAYGIKALFSEESTIVRTYGAGAERRSKLFAKWRAVK